MEPTPAWSVSPFLMLLASLENYRGLSRRSQVLFILTHKGRQQKNIITNTNRDGEGAGGRGARAAICEQDPARAGEVDGGDGVRDLFNVTLKGIEPKLMGSFNWCYRWRAPSPPPMIGPARASSP